MKRVVIRIALGVAILGMFTSEAWTWQEDAANAEKSRLSFRLKISAGDEPAAEAGQAEENFVFWSLPFVKFAVRHDSGTCCSDKGCSDKSCGDKCCSEAGKTCSAGKQTIAKAEAVELSSACEANRHATLTVQAVTPERAVQWIPATACEPSAAAHTLTVTSQSCVAQAAAQGCCQGSCPTGFTANPFTATAAMIPPPCPPGVGCGKPMCDDDCPLAIHTQDIHIQAIPHPTACPACPMEPARRSAPNFAGHRHQFHGDMHHELMEARIQIVRLEAQSEMLQMLSEQQAQYLEEKLDLQAEMMQAFMELKESYLEEKIELSSELARLQGTSELMGNLIEPTMKLHADNARLQAIVEGHHQEMARDTATKRFENQAKVNELIVKLKQAEQEKIKLQQRLIELEEKYERMASERANDAEQPAIR